MGEIDTMSRILDNEDPIGAAVQARCENLPPQKYWPCQHIPEIDALFTLLDPSHIRAHNSDHHEAYVAVANIVNDFMPILLT